MRTLAILLAFVEISLSGAAIAAPTDSVEKLSTTLWRPNAPYCKDRLGKSFPSKLTSGGECDDRDSVIFNGLLCASGEVHACDAVARSQDPAPVLPARGGWWRSPRIALADAKCGAPDGKCDSFSHDQSLGVMLTIIVNRADPAYLARMGAWITWIEANAPCVVGNEPLCVRGWPRVCRDDTEPANFPLKGCSMRPGDFAMVQTVLSRLGLPLLSPSFPVKEVRDTIASFDGWAAPFVLTGAAMNSFGYPSHLAGVGVLILRRLGPTAEEAQILDLAASFLHRRQPRNPFFAMLAGQPKAAVAQLVLDVCPKTAAELPKDRTEWIWERKDGSDAPQRSMLWDCVFMANMLSK